MNMHTKHELSTLKKKNIIDPNFIHINLPNFQNVLYYIQDTLHFIIKGRLVIHPLLLSDSIDTQITALCSSDTKW